MVKIDFGVISLTFADFKYFFEDTNRYLDDNYLKCFYFVATFCAKNIPSSMTIIFLFKP